MKTSEYPLYDMYYKITLKNSLYIYPYISQNNMNYNILEELSANKNEQFKAN